MRIYYTLFCILGIWNASYTMDNQKTLDAYDAHIEQYATLTPQEVSGSAKEWIDKALTYLPLGSKILELGSGTGRDADYIQSRGHQVQTSDATPGFVRFLQNKGYSNALLLNALTDDLGGSYDMIFANAVLLHFNPDQLQEILAKIHAGLKHNGILAFSVKLGQGSGWSEEKLGAPRYYYYWQQESLATLLKQTGFKNVDMTVRSDNIFLFVIAHV